MQVGTSLNCYRTTRSRYSYAHTSPRSVARLPPSAIMPARASFAMHLIHSMDQRRSFSRYHHHRCAESDRDRGGGIQACEVDTGVAVAGRHVPAIENPTGAAG